MELNIRRIKWDETIPIRQEVLWPHKPPEYCHIEGDEDAWHFGAYIGEKLVAVASVYQKNNKARLRKFATLKEYQNKGIGSQVLTQILSEIPAYGITYFWCDARESAMNIYMKFGFKKLGDRFYKSDIPYYKMYLEI